MSLDRIRESIVGKAEKEKKEIIDRARADWQEKTDSFKAAMKEDIERRLEGVDHEYREKIKRKILALKRENRLKLLMIKNNIIDDIFGQALDHFIKQPDDKYIAMLERWFLNIGTDLPGEMLLNAGDLKRIDRGFIERINKHRQVGARVDLSNNPINIKGGFIFRTGRFEIDQTLDTKIADLRRELAPMIAKELFNEG